jgi:plastocyanin domain-containing protein
VDTASGDFAPGQIVLKAGIPAEISFGSAVGCLSEVVIKDLGINQDLTQGPATVKLPALDAGTYSFACAQGHQTGRIVVQ